jgi:hypothetical protein
MLRQQFMLARELRHFPREDGENVLLLDAVVHFQHAAEFVAEGEELADGHS